MISHLYYPELNPKAFKLMIKAIKIPNENPEQKKNYEYYNNIENNENHSYAFTKECVYGLSYITCNSKNENYNYKNKQWISNPISYQEGCKNVFISKEKFSDDEIKTIINKWYKYIPINFFFDKVNETYFTTRIIYEFDVPEMKKVGYSWDKIPLFIERKIYNNYKYFSSDSLIKCIKCASWNFDESDRYGDAEEKEEKEEKEEILPSDDPYINRFRILYKGVEYAKECFCLESYGFYISLYYYNDIKLKPEFVFLLGLI